ncbi:MAG: hypothetical protein J1F04_01740 [Oscillospiraceae bacterium]|nr:hypothetical protein [Oscillospiraceae bacterium]MCH5207580.1 hypothetical protein [Oscillospiraceae bacterium]
MAKRGIKPPVVPHIVKTCYDENGRVIGYIADNFVERDPAKIQEILDDIADIWARAEAQKAIENAK